MSFDVSPSYDRMGVGQRMCVPYRAALNYYYGLNTVSASLITVVEFETLIALRHAIPHRALYTIQAAIRDR